MLILGCVTKLFHSMIAHQDTSEEEEQDEKKMGSPIHPQCRCKQNHKVL